MAYELKNENLDEQKLKTRFNIQFGRIAEEKSYYLGQYYDNLVQIFLRKSTLESESKSLLYDQYKNIFSDQSLVSKVLIDRLLAKYLDTQLEAVGITEDLKVALGNYKRLFK